MKTKDGFTLNDGDTCWVTCAGSEGYWDAGNKLYKAIYRSEHAEDMGWDFEVEGVEDEVEITGTWKEKPDL